MSTADSTEMEVGEPIGGRADDASEQVSQSFAALAVGYLAALSAAELMTALVAPRVGLALHAMLLVALLLHTALTHGEDVHRLLLCLSLVPLMRLLSLSLPLADFRLQYRYVVVTVPLLAATVVAMQVLNLSWQDVGLKAGNFPVQLSMTLVGLPLGYAEYCILRPEPLVETLALGKAALPSLILMMCTGFGEELVFRGVIQLTAGQVLGRWDVVYVATLSAVTCAGHQSLINVFFVLGVAVVLGWIRRRTGSILGVSLAHGLTNVVLFLVMPLAEG
jgi:membrane protease YdiL (CAAX protease family)